MVDYLVGLEQRKPYEWIVIEIFREEADALDYAANFAEGRGYTQTSRRRWRYGAGDGQHLIVQKRKG